MIIFRLNLCFLQLVILISGCVSYNYDPNYDIYSHSLLDLFGESSENEGRFFTIDREIAFNTSAAFMIPLWNFHLPGIMATSMHNTTKIIVNHMGVMGLLTIWLFGFLLTAIYVNTKDLNTGPAADIKRSFHYERHFDNRFLNFAYFAAEGLPEAFSMESCVKLLICEVHADPEKYGPLAWPIRLLVKAKIGGSDEDLSIFETAALVGFEQKSDCYYEYPCLLNPLNFIQESNEYFTNSIDSYF